MYLKVLLAHTVVGVFETENLWSLPGEGLGEVVK